MKKSTRHSIGVFLVALPVAVTLIYLLSAFIIITGWYGVAALGITVAAVACIVGGLYLQDLGD